jgi:rSAM/selenodomain-associated transferase 2
MHDHRSATAVSIIMPVLNEAAGMADALAPLQGARDAGVELIVVDGGSSDDTMRIAGGRCDQVLEAPRGRARQMNAGAARARGGILLFLHADTRLPENGVDALLRAVRQGACWGRFDVRIGGDHPLLGLVARSMNLRSRLTGIATGDQAIFATRDAFEAVRGFPEQPLMEDIALSRALKRLGRPACLHEQVLTSGRRWETHGVWRTILLMWRLRAAYALGADPARLAQQYGYRS